MDDREFFAAAKKMTEQALMAGDPRDQSEYELEAFILSDLENLYAAFTGLADAIGYELSDREDAP